MYGRAGVIIGRTSELVFSLTISPLAFTRTIVTIKYRNCNWVTLWHKICGKTCLTQVKSVACRYTDTKQIVPT